MIWLSVNFDVFIKNLLRLWYEKILLLTSVNLWGDYPKGFDSKTAIDSALVETERGNECCFALAKECVESWGKYLRENGIECNFP